MHDMAVKLTLYFYLLMEKPLRCYFQVWSPYYQAAQCNQKNTYSCILKVTGRSEKAKKDYASILITASTSVNLPKPVSTELTIKSDLILTNTIRKDGVQG